MRSSSPWLGGVLILCAAMLPSSAAGGEHEHHGLWVWKTSSVLDSAQASKALRDFCASNGVDEVYLSFSSKQSKSDEQRLADCVAELHRAHLAAAALLSSTDADEPGKARDRFLAHVNEVVEFNRQHHPAERFDGIHLDIEPYQRAENKGAGNLAFLPNEIEVLRLVRSAAEGAKMGVDADIPVKVLKADREQRRALLRSVTRVTLMLYELSNPSDGQSAQEQTDKLAEQAGKYLKMAYEGVDDADAARMTVALRTADYQALLPRMLSSLDATFDGNPHYGGWARHSYNDTLSSNSQ